MGMVPNFQPKDVANALDLVLHMLGILSGGGKISPEDVEGLKHQIEKLRNCRQ